MVNWSARLLGSQSFELDIYSSFGAIWFMSGQIQVKSVPIQVESATIRAEFAPICGGIAQGETKNVLMNQRGFL
jgi:hypothetical protein